MGKDEQTKSTSKDIFSLKGLKGIDAEIKERKLQTKAKDKEQSL